MIRRLGSTFRFYETKLGPAYTWFGGQNFLWVHSRCLIDIIAQLHERAPDAKILLLSPGYIDETQRLRAMLGQGRRPGDPLDRNNAQTAQYASACADVAATVGWGDNFAFLDVYGYFVKNYSSDDQRALILRDGLHFTSHGDQIFYELVKDKIETMVPVSVLRRHQYLDDIEILL